MNHKRAISGRVIASVTHSPWRTMRRIWRGWRAPWPARSAVPWRWPRRSEHHPGVEQRRRQGGRRQRRRPEPRQHQHLGRVDQDLGELRQDERTAPGRASPEARARAPRGRGEGSSPSRLGMRGHGPVVLFSVGRGETYTASARPKASTASGWVASTLGHGGSKPRAAAPRRTCCAHAIGAELLEDNRLGINKCCPRLRSSSLPRGR